MKDVIFAFFAVIIGFLCAIAGFYQLMAGHNGYAVVLMLLALAIGLPLLVFAKKRYDESR